MNKEHSITNQLLVTYCGSEVAIYLINGICLLGYLVKFDDIGLVLDNRDKQQLIFRQAVATVVPQTN